MLSNLTDAGIEKILAALQVVNRKNKSEKIDDESFIKIGGDNSVTETPLSSYMDFRNSNYTSERIISGIRNYLNIDENDVLGESLNTMIKDPFTLYRELKNKSIYP